MLKHLTDAQYEEMVTVANSVPWIDVIGEAEVVGEDNIYTNSLITIKATLTRCNWLEVHTLAHWAGSALLLAKQQLYSGDKLDG
jgi:hypothetical protein